MSTFKNKKIAAFLLAAALLLSVTSCVSPPQDNVEGETREELTYTPREDYEIDLDVVNEYNRYKEKSALAFSTNLPLGASAFEYTVSDSGVTISKYLGDEEIAVIPEMIDGKKVVAIADEAFKESSVRAVYIPDTVKKIGFAAFRDCDSLATLRLSVLGDGAQNTHIGYIFGAEKHEDNSLYVPRSLEMLIIGDKVNQIPDYACFGLRGIKALILPKKLESIGKFAFYECESLLYIGMQEVAILGKYSFAYCKSLISFETPYAISKIGLGSLMGCSSLKSLTLSYLGETAKAKGYIGHIFGAERPEWNETYIPASLTDIKLLDSCKKIDAQAFSDCHGLLNINLSNSIKSIGARAFSYCYSIKNLSLPETLTEIDDDAFFYCFSLENIDFGENPSLESIGKQAFFGCSSLKSISIPKGVTEIKESTFYGCSSLNELETAAEVEIKKDALVGCPALQKAE